MITLDQSIQYLKGVGPKRAELFSNMGITTLRDLLSFFPREYEDRRSAQKIVTLTDGQKGFVHGKVEASEVVKAGPRLSIFKAAITDGTGVVYAAFFRQMNPYHKHDIFAALKKDFLKGNYVFVKGAVEVDFGKKQIRVEEYEASNPQTHLNESIHFNKIAPIYPLTEGISQKWLREFAYTNLPKLSIEWSESVPEQIAKEEKLMAQQDAVRAIHFPKTLEEAENARRSIAFSEFLLLETALSLVRAKTKLEIKSFSYKIKKTLLTPFKVKLGFEFTAAQKKVINEIFGDMQKTAPMNRLLMGDVGSGKTAVALSAMLLAAENGYQSALLAPTEILAEQHFIKFERLFAGLNVKIAIVTGKLAASAKTQKETLNKIASGEIDIVIGTHAILEKKIEFKALSLIVIDEQHRFGVLQRAALGQKAVHPDVLVMTATPIPRTLALTVYGDLDVSVIDQLPPGRIPVSTMKVSQDKAYALLRQEIKKGRQGYIVYPLVEESDKLELKAAVKEAENLSQTTFSDLKVGLLHGQMKSSEKEAVMSSFCDKKIDILISTTVIEVGIDVSNATVMIIEHAERFGLATLHQLRGRIGRGSEKSYCILLGNFRSETAGKRIGVMLSTTDGFKVAEEDLDIRGPGEFFGTSQHGLPLLKAGNLIKDIGLIEKAKIHASQIIEKDPELEAMANSKLRAELIRSYKGKFGLSKIG